MESPTKDPCRLCSECQAMQQVSCSIRFSYCMSRHNVECDIIRLSAVCLACQLINDVILNNGKNMGRCFSAAVGSQSTFYLQFSKQWVRGLSYFQYSPNIMLLVRWFVFEKTCAFSEIINGHTESLLEIHALSQTVMRKYKLKSK